MIDYSESKASSNGRWTKQEHQKFLLGTPFLKPGLQLYGRDWKKIEEIIGTRSGSQIRSHAQKFFLKTRKSLDSPPSQDAQLSAFDSPSALPNLEKELSESSDTGTDFSYFFNRMYSLSDAEPNSATTRAALTSGRS